MERKFQFKLAVAMVTLVLVLAVMVGCAPQGPSQGLIRILGSAAGGTSQTALIATGEIITKYNTAGLRVAVQETLGSEDNRRMYKAMGTEEKKATVLNCDSQGYAVLKREGTDMKSIARLLTSAFGFVTLRKEINSVEDLVGKRVVVGPKGGGIFNVSTAILEAHGILDKMTDANLLYMSYNDGAQALLDGLADAEITFYSFDLAGTRAEPPPYMVPVTQNKDMKIIGMSKNAIDKLSTVKMPVGYFQMPGKVLPYAPNPFVLAVEDNSVIRGADVISSDVVYQMVKTMCENDKKYLDYSKAFFQIEAKYMAWLPLEEKDFHPGAVKYYKEKGIKIGR